MLNYHGMSLEEFEALVAKAKALASEIADALERLEAGPVEGLFALAIVMCNVVVEDEPIHFDTIRQVFATVKDVWPTRLPDIITDIAPVKHDPNNPPN